MSFMNPVDMVDEDAADLQFPKGNNQPSTNCFLNLQLNLIEELGTRGRTTSGAVASTT